MRKIQRHTQAEMYAHAEACKNSNLSHHAYCKANGIASSTLYYWAKKYKNECSGNKCQEPVPGFIPVEVQPDPQSNKVQNNGHLHFSVSKWNTSDVSGECSTRRAENAAKPNLIIAQSAPLAERLHNYLFIFSLSLKLN